MVRRKIIACAALTAVCMTGCGLFGSPVQEKPDEARTAVTEQAQPAEEREPEDGDVIASGEGQLQEEVELYTDNKEYYEENLSPDGTPVISGEYELSDCVTIGDLDGMDVHVSLEPEPTEEDAVIYAKLQKDGKPVASDYMIEMGDIVNIDMLAYIDGEQQENLSRKNMQIFMGSGGTRPEIEEALLGMTKGSSKDIEITYDEDYEYMELGGKTVSYNLYVNSIASALPPDEEELASAMEYLKERNTVVNDEIRMQAAKQAIMESAEFKAYPEKMVRQARSQYEKQRLREYSSIEDYLNDNGITREEFKQDEDIFASAGIKERLILEALKEKTGITLESKEYVDYVTVYGLIEEDADETLLRAIINANMNKLNFIEEEE